MSVREDLTKAGVELEQAIAARLFLKAGALLREYRARLDGVAADAPDREQILSEAASLFESSRRMTLGARAAAAAALAGLPASMAPYRAPDTRPRNTWEMTG